MCVMLVIYQESSHLLFSFFYTTTKNLNCVKYWNRSVKAELVTDDDDDDDDDIS